MFKCNSTIQNNRVTCLSSCCVPKVRSQINGVNGEATNTDDLAKKVDRKQNQRIAKLEKRLARLSVRKKSGASKKKKRIGRPTFKRMGPPRDSVFPGLPGLSSDGARAPITHKDPIVNSVVAQLEPFRVPRGIVSCLSNSKPSQKFTARSIATISPSSAGETLIFVSPCVANNPTFPSLVCYTGDIANMTAMTLNTGTLPAGLGRVIGFSNTPYSSQTLAGGDYEWRLVSAGVRIRNTNAAVNRSGRCNVYLDTSKHLVDWNLNTVTMNDIISALSGNSRVVRRNFAQHPEFEVALPGVAYASEAGPTWLKSSTDTDVNFWPLAGGPHRTNASVTFGYGGAIIHMPASGYAGNSIDIEVIEHWEVHGSMIETLHTPSTTHIHTSDFVASMVRETVHRHHASPEAPMHVVAKGVAYAEHHKAALKDAGAVATALAML